MTNKNCRPPLMVALNDLIFETKIRSTAEQMGVKLVVVRDVTKVCELLEKHSPPLLIVDLNSMGPDAIDVIRSAMDHSQNPHVLAFVSHVDQGLAEQARQAGAQNVMPRSRFSNELPQLIREHCTGAAGGD